jgi:mannosyltransferase OCH1-like enzyme
MERLMELLYFSPKRLIGIGCLVIAITIAFIGKGLYTKGDQPVDVSSYYVDFDQSMKLDLYPDIKYSAQGAQLLTFFRQLYEANSLKVVPDRQYVVIPKIIHIMWLGGKLPQEYESFVRSWRQLHPTWTIVFWTDNPANYDKGSQVLLSFDDLTADLNVHKESHDIVVDATSLVFDNKDMYDAAINYGEKSDILKWEIVYRFGGVYVDIDFQALKPLDPLHNRYDFYTGMQPLDTNMVQLGAALFAARPYHPILHACVTQIRNNKDIKQIIVKTGPIHFTRCFLMTAGQGGSIDIAFPSSYLYPCDYNQKGLPQDKWIKPESFAIHHWAGSWLKKEAFAPHAQ